MLSEFIQKEVPKKIRLVLIVITLLSAAGAASAPSTDIKTIPPLGYYSDYDWVAVPEGASDARVKKMIRAEVERLVKSNRQKRYSEAITIFQRWMDEKAELNEQWKKKTLELSARLRDKVAEVSSLRQEYIQLKNQLDVKETQLKALKETLKNDTLTLERYDNEKKFLKDNVAGQLEDLAYMVVAVGKRRLAVDEDLKDVRNLISNTMIIKAIEEVNGSEIQALTVVRENKLIRDYVKSVTSGYALALDSYTNDFAKLSEKNETIVFLVQAIEVNPFKEKSGIAKTRGSGAGAESTVHLINRGNLDKIWEKENLAGDATKNSIKDFIKRLLNQAEKQNREIEGKISEIQASYQKRLADVNQNISRISGSMESHRSELETLSVEYNDFKDKHDRYQECDLNPAIEGLKEVEKEYSRFYNQRIFLADKTEEGKPDKRAIDAYQDFAALAAAKMKDIKEAEYKNTVVTVDYKLDSYSEDIITYSPRIRAFTIIFLTKKELSTYVSYVASVGYQMELQPQEGKVVTTRGRKSTRAGYAGMTFVTIPAGSFMMGSNDGQSDEKPVHKVNIKSFQMMTTEVTQAQWQAVMGTTVEQQRDKANPSWSLSGVGDNNPMYYISWNECKEFIKKLNRLDPEKGYRLPTEAEWEYACRAGTSSKFHNGDSDRNLDAVAWYSGNSGRKTHPIGQKRANAWGLYDMHGNVWEWCQDWYHGSYSGAPKDGGAWDSPAGSYRLLRGGSWYYYPLICRSASRHRDSPVIRYNDVGFRLVRSS